MAKDLTKSKGRQELAVVFTPTETVEVPLPLLEALEDVEHAFVGVCIDAGEAVLAAMMERDRTVLCGPAWKPDASRSGRRAGSTESPITLGGRRIVVRRPRVRTEAPASPQRRAGGRRARGSGSSSQASCDPAAPE